MKIIIPIMFILFVTACNTVKHAESYEFEQRWDKQAKEKTPVAIAQWVDSDVGTKALNEKMSVWANEAVNRWRGAVAGGASAVFMGAGWLWYHMNGRSKKKVAELIDEGLKMKGKA